MNTISPKSIFDYLEERIVGQKEAKKAISNAVYMHYVRFIQSYYEPEKSIKKSNLLLMGPSGNGKTLLVKTAAEAVSKLVGYDVCPVLEMDATSITGSGWSGHDAEDLLGSHHERCKNEDVFHSSIVVIDEIDKLCMPAISSGGHDFNKTTQYSLLKLVEGTPLHGIKKMGRAQDLNTNNMLFIFAGNFPQIRHKREDSKKGIGFTYENDLDKQEDKSLHTQLEEAGMVTQLAGRISSVAELGVLNKQELKKILLELLIPDRQDTFEFMGTSFKLKAKDIDEIVEDCHKKKMGARGLEAALDAKLEDRIFNSSFSLQDKLLEDK